MLTTCKLVLNCNCNSLKFIIILKYFEAFTLDVAAEGIIVGSEIVILLEEFCQIHKVNGVVGLNGAVGLVQGWGPDGARGVEATKGWKRGVGWDL